MKGAYILTATSPAKKKSFWPNSCWLELRHVPILELQDIITSGILYSFWVITEPVEESILFVTPKINREVGLIYLKKYKVLLHRKRRHGCWVAKQTNIYLLQAVSIKIRNVHIFYLRNLTIGEKIVQFKKGTCRRILIPASFIMSQNLNKSELLISKGMA